MDTLAADNIKTLADTNLMRLANNRIPGIGIIVGLSNSNQLTLVAWSFDSTADISPLIALTKHVITYGVVSNTADASNFFANGFGKDYIHQDLIHGVTLGNEPNATPGISAACHWHKDTAVITMASVRKSIFGGKCCRTISEINGLMPGFGHYLTQFSSESNPLLSFFGEPPLIPLLGENTNEVYDFFSKKLVPLSLAVRCIAK